MGFDWLGHLKSLFAAPKRPTGFVPPQGIPHGIDNLENHKVDFRHGDLVDSVRDTLNAIKLGYHASGHTNLKTSHGHDPHLMAQDLAAGILADHGVLPQWTNGGRHRLHAVDTTPNGTSLRFHYASNDPMEPGHVFSLRGDGSLQYHGRSNHRNVGTYTSPFGLKDRQPSID